MNYKSK